MAKLLCTHAVYLLLRWAYNGADNEVLHTSFAAERSLFSDSDAHSAHSDREPAVPGGLLSLIGGTHSRVPHGKGAAVHEMTPLVNKCAI